MPAGVVVVKRARRRAFAILWAVPAWLNSIVSSLRRGGRRGDGDAQSFLTGDAVEEVQFPVLLLAPADDGLAASRRSKCNGCGDCVAVCPSRSLVLAVSDGRPTRFELDPGACIGCGRCVEICPEAALGAMEAEPVLMTNGAGRVVPIDLLASAERAR